MKLEGREEFIEADRCTWGTRYVILHKDGVEVAAYKTGEVKSTEEIEDGGQGAELLAEVRATGPQSDGGDEPEPDADADATPGESPGEVPRDAG